LAGYYLDLAPLIADDPALAVEDFFPTVWASFQWDKGTWGIPFSADTYILTYDSTAFDDAGIAYPSASWTLDDVILAARALVQKDEQGNVTRPGLDLFSAQADTALFRSLLGGPLFDASVVPSAPQIDTPAVEGLLTTWLELEQEGSIARSFNVAPMSVSPVLSLALPVINADGQVLTPRKGVLLPGGAAGLSVSGFAISAGTQHPQEAYALAKFLSTRSELSGGRISASPARRSVVGQDSTDPVRLNLTDEVQVVIDESIQAALPVAETRFLNYVLVAYNKMKTDQIDAKTALQEAEAAAQQNQQAALDRKASLVITVAPPPEDKATTDDGRVVLKFSLSSLFQRGGLPNQEEWDRVIADFIASDPTVGAVELVRGRGQLAEVLAQNDCVYLPYNAVPNADLSTILALDPFIDADPSFDKSDVVGDVLTQLTRDGKVWGYPFIVEPAILKYNMLTFDKTGAAQPIAGWTVDDFNAALRTIKVFPEDPAPFVDSGSGGTHLLILMAAYGGLPLDFRTDPPTLAYTDPATVDAIRQVLDLAKAGYIGYSKLSNFVGAGVFAGQVEDEQPAITTDNLNAFGFQFIRRGGRGLPGGGGGGGDTATTSDDYGSTTYPRGTSFTGASYSIGIGLVGVNATSPDGCYRFFNAIAGNAKLFQSMPARRSLINNPDIAAQQSGDLVALYTEIDRLLTEPTTIIFPSQVAGGASPTGFLLQFWLYQAFDRYVLEDKDLDTELATAEQYGRDFQACAASIPSPNFGDPQATRDYIREIGTCAVSVDPTLEPVFALIR
jgi:ABC-type glycerol-3-phosphate transport system substrate-binding protein